MLCYKHTHKTSCSMYKHPISNNNVKEAAFQIKLPHQTQRVINAIITVVIVAASLEKTNVYLCSVLTAQCTG